MSGENLEEEEENIWNNPSAYFFAGTTALSIILLISLSFVFLSDTSAKTSHPQPQVANVEADSGLEEVEAIVVNNGASADIVVRIVFIDSNGNQLMTKKKTVMIESKQKQKVIFDVSVPDNADDVKASAVPVSVISEAVEQMN